MKDRIYEIRAVITMNEHAVALNERTLASILRETGDIEDVERIEIREMA